MTKARDSCGVRRSALRRIGLVLVSLGAFALTAAAIGTVQSPIREATRGARFEAFLAQKDELDAVFVGSSRIQRGVSPAVIDARLSDEGREFRSFNLGIPGMRSFEGDALIRKILAAEPKQLRYLVVEGPRFSPEIWSAFEGTERYVDWHDATTTRMLLRALWRSGEPLKAKLWETVERLRTFLLRASNYATSSRFPRGANPVWDEMVGGWAEQQGFSALSEETPGVQRRRKRFLRDIDRFENHVRNLRWVASNGKLADPRVANTYDLDSLAEQAARIRAAGIVPVYVATPQITRGPDFETFRRDGIIDHLIDLRDPRAYPEFFAPEHRFDREHMNEEGARLLSATIAEKLAPIVASTPREDAG